LISLIIMLIAPSKIYIFAVWIIILTIILYIAKKGVFITILNYIINLSVGISAPFLWNKLKPYQQNRIKNFLNPELDPRGAGYQILQSKTAIGSGGASGKGFLHGTQSQLRFLPQQHTDFIFSVFGEEFGFLGVICVLILYFFIILHGITIAVIAKNRFAGLVAIGISSVIFIHVFVNISMTVGLLPVTGLPLPFMSYGGSAMISFLAMIGILINISVNKLKY
ncbi:rod shape-determining protein RodA, partial [bacterium]|nr:rod shape-determining protein RodA [bacterium]